MRNNLRLMGGQQSIVNLTMSTIFEADNWLPRNAAARMNPRMTGSGRCGRVANRPLLRLTDPEDGVEIFFER